MVNLFGFKTSLLVVLYMFTCTITLIYKLVSILIDYNITNSLPLSEWLSLSDMTKTRNGLENGLVNGLS